MASRLTWSASHGSEFLCECEEIRALGGPSTSNTPAGVRNSDSGGPSTSNTPAGVRKSEKPRGLTSQDPGASGLSFRVELPG